MNAKTPLPQVLLEYAARREVTEQTRKAYSVSLKVLTEVTGLKTAGDFEKARPGELQDAFDAAIAEERYSRKTLAMALTLGKGLRSFLRLRDVVKENPFDAVKVRVGNNVPEHNVLKPGEVDTVLKYLVPGEEMPMRYVLLWRAVFLLLVRHGFRVHELAKLRAADVSDDADGAVATFKGKGGKLARLRLSREAVEAVSKWRAFCARSPGGNRSPDPYVPGEVTGTALSRGTVWANVVHITEAALGHRVTPHGLRATFISEVISKRGIEHARKLARHSSLTTTQRYSRWEVLDVED